MKKIITLFLLMTAQGFAFPTSDQKVNVFGWFDAHTEDCYVFNLVVLLAPAEAPAFHKFQIYLRPYYDRSLYTNKLSGTLESSAGTISWERSVCFVRPGENKFVYKGNNGIERRISISLQPSKEWDQLCVQFDVEFPQEPVLHFMRLKKISAPRVGEIIIFGGFG